MAYYYDPYNMIAGVLAEEYAAGTFGYDADRGHLMRAAGPCRYCNNATWQFPEGCAYGNDAVQPYPPGHLEEIVQQILSTPSRKYDVIRPPLHPPCRPASLLKYNRGTSAVAADQQGGASAPSIRHRTYGTGY